MWFHIECLGLSIDEAQAMETYICKECSEKGLDKKATNQNSTTGTEANRNADKGE